MEQTNGHSIRIKKVVEIRVFDIIGKELVVKTISSFKPNYLLTEKKGQLRIFHLAIPVISFIYLLIQSEAPLFCFV